MAGECGERAGCGVWTGRGEDGMGMDCGEGVMMVSGEVDDD